MFDGQCFSDKIFILAPPFTPAPPPVAAIAQPCSNSIAIDGKNGDMAAPSGAVLGTLSVRIYHPPYSTASAPSVSFTPAKLSHPRGSAWDEDDNLWVADDAAGRVFEFRPPFSAKTVAAAENGVATQPAGLTVDRVSRQMFVTDLGGNYKCEVTACHVFVIPAPYTGGAIATLTFAHQQPFAVAVDSAGRLFVGIDTSETTATINVYKPPFVSGEEPAFALDPGGPVRTLAFDPHGNLFSQRLATGGVIEFAAPIDGPRSAPDASLGCPAGVTCVPRNWAGLAFGP